MHTQVYIVSKDFKFELAIDKETKLPVELKVNLRELIQIFNQRLCTRAYWEFRELMTDIKNALIEEGNRNEVEIWVQKKGIFEKMHTVS